MKADYVSQTNHYRLRLSDSELRSIVLSLQQSIATLQNHSNSALPPGMSSAYERWILDHQSMLAVLLPLSEGSSV